MWAKVKIEVCICLKRAISSSKFCQGRSHLFHRKCFNHLGFENCLIGSLASTLFPYIFYHLDSGIMTMGAINVVRGSRSSSEELLQIYNHSERFV